MIPEDFCPEIVKFQMIVLLILEISWLINFSLESLRGLFIP